MNNICSISDCKEKAKCRTWCEMHYARFRKHGDALKTLHQTKCSIENCMGKHYSRGYCLKHHTRIKRHGNPLHQSRKEPVMGSCLDRFNAKIDKTDNCWNWTGSIDSGGYGFFIKTLDKKSKVYKAHRFSYQHFKGDIPSGLLILHKCDNRKCVNPEHLFTGTQVDNMQDCIRKGRFKIVSDKFKAKGENAGNVKLNTEKVIKIKKMIRDGIGNRVIAKEFNVVHGCISNIRVGKSWKHISI